MTRREILEKNWKDFRLSTGLEYEPMSDKAYEFMENAMEHYAELRLGAVVERSELLISFVDALVESGIIEEDDINKEIYVQNFLKEINCR